MIAVAVAVVVVVGAGLLSCCYWHPWPIFCCGGGRVLATPSLRTLLSLPRGPLAGAQGGSRHLGKCTPRPTRRKQKRNKRETQTRTQDKNRTRGRPEHDYHATIRHSFLLELFFVSLTIKKSIPRNILRLPTQSSGQRRWERGRGCGKKSNNLKESVCM